MRDWETARSISAKLLEKVREVLKKLKRGTPGAVQEAIEAPYLKGVREAAAELGIRLEPAWIGNN